MHRRQEQGRAAVGPPREGDQKIGGGGVDRHRVFARGQAVHEEVVAQVLQHGEATVGVEGHHLRGGETARPQPVGDGHESIHPAAESRAMAL